MFWEHVPLTVLDANCVGAYDLFLKGSFMNLHDDCQSQNFGTSVQFIHIG